MPILAPRYGPPCYYPPCYLGGPSSAPAALDLVDAVEAYLQPRFVATGILRWAGAAELPPGLGMPYAIVGGDLEETADYQEDGSGHAPYDDEGTFSVRAIAPTKAAAKSLSAQLSRSLTDAPLRFRDGQLLQIRRTSRGEPVLEDEDGPEGQLCWIAHLMFSTIVSKTL
jgi:hypothetical protein